MARKSTYLAVIALAFFTVGACAHSASSETQPPNTNHDNGDSIADLADSGTRADMVTKIDIEVTLVGYSDQYYRFHYEDGGVDFHKISAFRIVEPTEYSGRSLNIRHQDSPATDSIWRSEGTVLRLRLLKSDLEFIVDAIGSLGVQLVEVLDTES